MLVTQKETPRIEIREMGGEPNLNVEMGYRDDSDFVHVHLEEPLSEEKQGGSIFLGLTIGTVGPNGEESFDEFGGCVAPNQLDSLIACLSIARHSAAKRGWLTKGVLAR